MLVTAPTTFEQIHWDKGYTHIAGIDEVGRGAWAGPLVVAAVIFPPYFSTSLPINDSKKVPKKLREILATEIKKLAMAYTIVEVGLDIINTHGIGYAAQIGFSQAFSQLSQTIDHLLIDAFNIKSIPAEKQTAIIRGDSQSISIAAASIIAKVHRDNLMNLLDQTEPAYQFGRNMGYGTAAHRNAIKQHGLSNYHRKSYRLDRWL